jgi:F-type H+-transporting ATPase subunit epsilon
MAATFRLEITTPDRPMLDEPVTEAQIPAENGYLGILPEHAPLLAELGHGLLTYRTGGHEESVVVHGGFVEVLPAHVRVLAQAAELPSDIDVQRAQSALDRALKRMRIDVGDVDRARAAKALRRAEARLAASKR